MTNIHQKKAYGWISKSIIKVLSEDLIDKESLDTFSIYLKFTALNECYSIIPDMSLIIGQLYHTMSNTINDTAKNDFDIYFRNNQLILLEIFDEVWQNIPNEDTNWLKGWKSICHEIIENGAEKQPILVSLFEIIDDHLQINSHAALMMQYVIYKTLNFRIPDHTLISL